MENGDTVNLFVKYLADGGANNFGHRGGLLYEADFYKDVLSTLPISQIKYYGTCKLGDDSIMVLDFLEDSLRFAKSKDRHSLEKAASWLGKFHSFKHDKVPGYITRYDEAYYNVWLNKFIKIADPLSEEFPILREVITCFSENSWMLTEGPNTFIHGEYYSRNVLYKDGTIYPVDWESAGWASGEIDLASLIEQWDQVTISNAKAAYITARWPEGDFSLVDFEKRLILCKMYFFFRWCPFRLDEINWIRKEKVYTIQFSLT